MELRNNETLLSTRLGDEYIVYDKVRRAVHLLTSTHHQVLTHQETSDAELAQKLFPEDECEVALSKLSLVREQLMEKGLLGEVVPHPPRRAFLKTSILAATLPAIISMATSLPAAADSLGTVVFSNSNPTFAVPGAATGATYENIGGGGGGGGNGANSGGVGGVGSRGATVSGGPIAVSGTINVQVGSGGTGGVNGAGGGTGGPGGSPSGASGGPGMLGTGTGTRGAGGGGAGGTSSVNGTGAALGGAGGGGGGGASVPGAAPPAAPGGIGRSGLAGGAGGLGGNDGAGNVGGMGGSGAFGNVAAQGPVGPGRGGGASAGSRNGTAGQVTVTFCIL